MILNSLYRELVGVPMTASPEGVIDTNVYLGMWTEVPPRRHSHYVEDFYKDYEDEIYQTIESIGDMFWAEIEWFKEALMSMRKSIGYVGY